MQGLGAFLIDRIEGEYWNVVGFPLSGWLRYMEEVVDKGQLLADDE